MRILNILLRWLCLCPIVLGAHCLCLGADRPANVVLDYHFVGAGQLAGDTNALVAKAVLGLPSTVAFEDLALNRLSATLAASLHFSTNAETVALLRPLLDDLLASESLASMGGSPGKPLSFVLAIQLDGERTQLWQQNLKKANHGRGKEFRTGKFSGWQWNQGADDSLWMVPARDWLLVGSGGELESVRSDYLQQIQKLGQPGLTMDVNWFEADVDWPRLANWFPISSCPLKLARTQIGIRSEYGHFEMTGRVIYPEEISWKPHPRSFPTTLVREPLLSFATGQDVEPFLKSDDTLSRFCTNPLSDQFYFWSMGELAFQSYLAWPVSNPTNTMAKLSGQAIADLNPKLQQFDGTKLAWLPKRSQIAWMKLPLINPIVFPAPASNGQFLVAGLFASTRGTGPAPKALWNQLDGRNDLVYYDWELTGPRVRHLLTVTEVIPILPMLGIGPSRAASFVDPRLDAVRQWLLGLTPLLANTATEVTKTGPNELKIFRSSPFVFSSLELVLLSHWLTDTSAGPLDWSLLPQAKMSGPGVPPGH